MGRWMDGWMDGWVDGWMDEWVDGWVDGWVGGYRGILRGLLTQANPPCCFLRRGGLSPGHFTFVAHPKNSWRRSPVNAGLLQHDPLRSRLGSLTKCPALLLSTIRAVLSGLASHGPSLVGRPAGHGPL